MIKVLNIVGARPNFMKIAPIHHLMQRDKQFEPILVHTGQHYDERMSQFFFNDLGLPKPDVYLGVGSGSHAVQTASIMTTFEPIIEQENPDLVLVVGDVNSTIACTLVASKLHIPIAHVEAGLRSFDRKMPEEINRVLTDSIADFLFVTERSGLINLQNEGVNQDKVFFVGHVMIDSLIQNLEKASKSSILSDLKVDSGSYGLITLHRPSNVDDPKPLEEIFAAFAEIQKDIPLYFPIHPRTRKNLAHFNFDSLLNSMDNFHLLEPLGYLDFLQMQKHARVLFTDSGGIQEESTYLKIPCITLRENTERPVTIEIGTNQLVASKKEDIISAWKNVQNRDFSTAQIPELWDGKAAHRIVEIIKKSF